MGRIEDILGDTVSRIRSVCDPQKIILFGSYASGISTKDSDVDLMIVLSTDEQPHRRSLPILRALRGLPYPKDIVVKTPAEFERYRDVIGTIIYPAAHFGAVLYERP